MMPAIVSPDGHGIVKSVSSTVGVLFTAVGVLFTLCHLGTAKSCVSHEDYPNAQ